MRQREESPKEPSWELSEGRTHTACTSMWAWGPSPETHKILRHVVHNWNPNAVRWGSWIPGVCWTSHPSPKKKIISNNQGFYTHKCIYTCAHTYVPTTTEIYTDIWPPYSDSNGKKKQDGFVKGGHLLVPGHPASLESKIITKKTYYLKHCLEN